MNYSLGSKVNLEVTGIASAGDGKAHLEGRDVYIPYTLPEEKLEVEIITITSDRIKAKAITIDKFNNSLRQEPICKHFTKCGGCSLQHFNTEYYLQFKRGIVERAIKRAGFEWTKPIEIIEAPLYSRRRANFKAKNNKIGFFEADSNNLVAIEECFILSKPLFDLMKPLESLLAQGLSFSQVQVTEIESGLDVVIYSENDAQKIPEGFYLENNIQRLVWKSGKLLVLYERSPTIKIVNNIAISLPEEYFLQATEMAESTIIKELQANIGNSKNILDLFSGLGAYSFSLHQGRNIHAIEIADNMVKKIEQAAKKNNLKNITTSVANLDKNPVKTQKLNEFDAVIINPPRTGALNQSKELMNSSVKKIIMVSCNPDTFARDTKFLNSGGYKLENIKAIDQFKFTHHLELVGVFSK